MSVTKESKRLWHFQTLEDIKGGDNKFLFTDVEKYCRGKKASQLTQAWYDFTCIK